MAQSSTYTGKTVTGLDGKQYLEIKYTDADGSTIFYYQDIANKDTGPTGAATYYGTSADPKTWTKIEETAPDQTGALTEEQIMQMYGGGTPDTMSPQELALQQQAQALSQWQAQQGSAMSAWDRAFQQNQAAMERATNPLEIVPYLYASRGGQVPDWWKTAYQELPSPWESPAWTGGQAAGINAAPPVVAGMNNQVSSADLAEQIWNNLAAQRPVPTPTPTPTPMPTPTYTTPAIWRTPNAPATGNWSTPMAFGTNWAAPGATNTAAQNALAQWINRKK